MRDENADAPTAIAMIASSGFQGLIVLPRYLYIHGPTSVEHLGNSWWEIAISLDDQTDLVPILDGQTEILSALDAAGLKARMRIEHGLRRSKKERPWQRYWLLITGSCPLDVEEEAVTGGVLVSWSEQGGRKAEAATRLLLSGSQA